MNRYCISNDEWPAAAHAKSLLYLIKGETFGFNVPVLPRSSASVSDKKLGTSQLVVYPNPSNQLLSVETSEGIDILELQLIDLQGSIIKSSLPGMQKYQLETSTIPQGTYLLKVNLSNQTVETVKVHIVH
jgi:hypothetical protein